MEHEFNEKEYWKKVHELNDNRLMKQLTERYMKENFKYVNKFVITSPMAFAFTTIVILFGMALIGINFIGDVNVTSCLMPITYMIGTVCVVMGGINLRDCFTYEKTKVPLTETDKLLGD